MVQGLERESFLSLDHATLKREITQYFSGMFVSLRIPHGSRIKSRVSKSVVAEPGVAYFEIQRCHLSSGVQDVNVLEVEEENPPKHDVSDEFKLRGGLCSEKFIERLMKEDGDTSAYEGHPYHFVEIPCRWITAILTPECEWRAVPR